MLRQKRCPSNGKACTPRKKKPLWRRNRSLAILGVEKNSRGDGGKRAIVPKKGRPTRERISPLEGGVGPAGAPMRKGSVFHWRARYSASKGVKEGGKETMHIVQDALSPSLKKIKLGGGKASRGRFATALLVAGGKGLGGGTQPPEEGFPTCRSKEG